MPEYGPMLPLSLVRAGDAVTVRRVGGGDDMRRHLREIGFVAGAEVHVVSACGSNLIVQVKGARFGVDVKVAQRIMVA